MFHSHNLIKSYSLAKIQEENVELTRKPTRWNPPNPPYYPELDLLKLPNINLEMSKQPKNTLPIQCINQIQMKDCVTIVRPNGSLAISVKNPNSI